MDYMNLRYAYNENLMFRKMNDTIMVYNPENSDMYELNEISDEIIEKLKSGIEIKDIITSLVCEYDAPEDVVKTDVFELLQRFIELGIIKLSN